MKALALTLQVFTLCTLAGLIRLFSFPPQNCLSATQFSSGTVKYKREIWFWHQLPSHFHNLPANKQTYIYYYIYTHTHARRHIHTDRTERKGGIAGKGESHNPAVRPRGLSRRAVFHAPTSEVHGSRVLPASAHRESACLLGKSRHGCSPAASRLGL